MSYSNRFFIVVPQFMYNIQYSQGSRKTTENSENHVELLDDTDKKKFFLCKRNQTIPHLVKSIEAGYLTGYLDSLY